MAYRHQQPNFSKGVLTEELWGRSDIAPWNAAVRQGTNVLILKYGGLTKRPGTRFVYEITEDLDAFRLFPFEGAYDASYAMVMGQATMRLAALGGMVVEEKLTIEGIVLNNPIEIEVSFHDLDDGDEIYFSEVEGSTELNGLIYPVTVIDADHFSVPVDGADISAFTGDAGGITRPGAPDPPPTPPTVPVPEDPPTPPVLGGGGLGWKPPSGGVDDRQIP